MKIKFEFDNWELDVLGIIIGDQIIALLRIILNISEKIIKKLRRYFRFGVFNVHHY